MASEAGVTAVQVGMRVDLELADGSKACGVFVHKKLSDSAGYAHPLDRCNYPYSSSASSRFGRCCMGIHSDLVS